MGNRRRETGADREGINLAGLLMAVLLFGLCAAGLYPLMRNLSSREAYSKTAAAGQTCPPPNPNTQIQQTAANPEASEGGEESRPVEFIPGNKNKNQDQAAASNVHAEVQSGNAVSASNDGEPQKVVAPVNSQTQPTQPQPAYKIMRTQDIKDANKIKVAKIVAVKSPNVHRRKNPETASASEKWKRTSAGRSEVSIRKTEPSVKQKETPAPVPGQSEKPVQKSIEKIDEKALSGKSIPWYSVHVGYTDSKERVEILRDVLKEQGFTSAKEAKTDNGYYYVSIGNFSFRHEAEKVSEDVKAKTNLNPSIYEKTVAK